MRSTDQGKETWVSAIGCQQGHLMKFSVRNCDERKRVRRNHRGRLIRGAGWLTGSSSGEERAEIALKSR